MCNNSHCSRCFFYKYFCWRDTNHTNNIVGVNVEDIDSSISECYYVKQLSKPLTDEFTYIDNPIHRTRVGYRTSMSR